MLVEVGGGEYGRADEQYAGAGGVLGPARPVPAAEPDGEEEAGGYQGREADHGELVVQPAVRRGVRERVQHPGGALEVERVLLQVAGVREAAVVGRAHPALGEVPVAFVLADGHAVDVLARVQAACVRLLPSFKRPAEVRVVPELPRSTLNKVAKSALRRLVSPDTS